MFSNSKIQNFQKGFTLLTVFLMMVIIGTIVLALAFFFSRQVGIGKTAASYVGAEANATTGEELAKYINNKEAPLGAPPGTSGICNACSVGSYLPNGATCSASGTCNLMTCGTDGSCEVIITTPGSMEDATVSPSAPGACGSGGSTLSLHVEGSFEGAIVGNDSTTTTGGSATTCTSDNDCVACPGDQGCDSFLHCTSISL